MSEIQEGTLATPLPWKGITTGRIVHVLSYKLEHLPAIVTRVLDKERGIVNLTIFPDLEDPIVRDSVSYDETVQTIGSWHWTERA